MIISTDTLQKNSALLNLSEGELLSRIENHVIMYMVPGLKTARQKKDYELCAFLLENVSSHCAAVGVMDCSIIAFSAYKELRAGEEDEGLNMLNNLLARIELDFNSLKSQHVTEKIVEQSATTSDDFMVERNQPEVEKREDLNA